ncbi:hypothetical protein QQP08_003897 [Theobroma cacao]|uniref:Uncharacterized protein n=1 Tax=Theobroma cacao TaxID=3641 RepID=A0A061DQL6_THECC|nr:Uncharacterized protein TCM_001203 [Theobroma cacao]WRX11410.1 hypothetical protein QQP08_003897 [Theobroma cacao]
MSSIGASCAEVYLMRKRQKEKMKRMEEERVKRGETTTGIEERKAGTIVGRSKVHPGNFTSPADSAAGNESLGTGNAA